LDHSTNFVDPDPKERLIIDAYETDEEESEDEEEDENENAQNNAKETKELIKALDKIADKMNHKEHMHLPIPTFDGTQDPIDWINRFNDVCKTNNIENGKRVTMVTLAMRGQAAIWWQGIKHRIRTYKITDKDHQQESFIYQFMEEFCGQERQMRWQDELRNLKMKPGETVAEYSFKLIDLYRKGDPFHRFPKEDKLQQFMRGLNPNIKTIVRWQRPQDLQEAIAMAKTAEMSLNENPSFIGGSTSPDLRQGINEIKAMITQQNQVKPVPTCNLCYKQGDHTTENCPRRTFKPKNESTQQYNRRPSPRTCFNCGKPGHISRDCIVRKNNNPRGCFICNQKGHMALSCPVIKNNEQAKRMIQMNQKNTRNNGPGNNQRKVYHTQITDDEDEISDTENENILATQKKLVNQMNQLTESIKSLKV
jgi:hypothetical protein